MAFTQAIESLPHIEPRALTLAETLQMFETGKRLDAKAWDELARSYERHAMVPHLGTRATRGIVEANWLDMNTASPQLDGPSEAPSL